MKYYLIFAYGSLVNFSSAEKTLHRPLNQDEIRKVWVNNYQRVWDYKSAVYSDSLQSTQTAIFLNLRRNDHSHVNGIVLRVNQEELKRLMLRESNYEMIDISNDLEKKIDSPVYAFICTDPKILSNADTGYVVMKKYIDMVSTGFARQGKSFYRAYLKTTQRHSYRVLFGNYSFPN